MPCYALANTSTRKIHAVNPALSDDSAVQLQAVNDHSVEIPNLAIM